VSDLPAVRDIERLLVANRGEIARRIFRTASQMGISTVGVYAEADAAAPFVREASLSVALGGRTATDTYLNIAKLIDACAASGADAVHPGYGFLSERAAFARAVLDAGLIWVGPPPAAIDAMGDKLSAKRLMAEAEVPVLPSVEISGPTAWRTRAIGLRFPLLVKASAGGGGRGMRVVLTEEELDAALESAQREAMSAFGDSTVFLERYLPDARHVEVQVLADEHNNYIHCFERDCSVQRRHQKLIEEAPSPALDDAMRARMGEAALAAIRAVNYRNAGTVEFIVEPDGQFWFLEVNTRLQVEHPVTEAVTG
jgi:propionyl-CoA carboxylase alpha chain